MAPPSQGVSSTNWKPALPLSNAHQMSSEMTNVMPVVHSDTWNMLRRAAASSPRMIRTISAPMLGRNVIVERIGQSNIVCPLPEHQPGDEDRHADQHRECVMIEVARLQADDALRHVEDAGGDAIGTEAVDQPAVAALPQEE